MRRSLRRRAGSAQSHVATAQALEDRVMLSADFQQDLDGTLHIDGTDAPESLTVTDLGHGTIFVEYQLLDDPDAPSEFRRFFDVLAVKVNMMGGDDDVEYFSDNDTESALPTLLVDLGDGTDTANAEVILSDPPKPGDGTTEHFFTIEIRGSRGDDSITTVFTTHTSGDDPTQPVQHVELHGDEGLDTLTFSANTATGGLTSRTEELELTANPDGQIWDLVDGDSGAVNGRVRGYGFIDVRSSATGIGRAVLDLEVIGAETDETITVDLVAHEGLREANLSLDGGGGIDDAMTAINADSLRGAFTVETANLEISTIRNEQLNNKYSEHMNHESMEGDSTSKLIIKSHPDSAPNLSIEASYIGSDGRDVVEIAASGDGIRELTVDVDTRDGDDSINVQQDRSLSWIVQRDWKVDMGGGLDELIFQDNVVDDGGVPAGDELSLSVQSAEKLRLDHQSPVGDLRVQADASAGPVTIPGFGSFTVSQRKARTELAAYDTVQIAAATREPVAGGRKTVRSHDFLSMSASAIDVDYNHFSTEGRPLRSVAASLAADPQRADADTRLDASIGVEEVTLAIEHFERGSASTLGFASAGLLMTNDELSLDLTAQADPQAARDPLFSSVTWVTGMAVQKSDVDVSLAGYDDARVATTFFEGRPLTAVDMKLEAVEVPNLKLTISMADFDESRIAITKEAEIADPATYASRYQFGLNDGVASYTLHEQNVAANRRYLYFAKVADVEGFPEVSMNIRPSGKGLLINEINSELQNGEISMAVDGISGAAIIDTEYAEFLSDGTTVRASAVSTLRTLAAAQTDYNSHIQREQFSLAAQGFEEYAVAVDGFSTTDVSLVHNDSSAAFHGEATGEFGTPNLQLSRFNRAEAELNLSATSFDDEAEYELKDRGPVSVNAAIAIPNLLDATKGANESAFGTVASLTYSHSFDEQRGLIVDMGANEFDALDLNLMTGGPAVVEAAIAIPNLLIARASSHESSAIGLPVHMSWSHRLVDDELTAAIDSTGFDETKLDADVTLGGSYINVHTAASGGDVDLGPVAKAFHVEINNDSNGIIPRVNATLVAYDHASVDINASEDSVLAAADIQVETVDVPNLNLQIVADDDSLPPIRIAKIVDPADRQTYHSHFKYGLSTWLTSYNLIEENITGFDFQADLPEHQIEIHHDAIDDFLIALVSQYTQDEISFFAEGLSGASKTDVSIAGTNPDDPMLDLQVKTADGSNGVHLTAEILRLSETATAPLQLNVALEGLTIESARLVATGFAGMTRRLSDVAISGRYAESIDMAPDETGQAGKPLLIIAEDVEVLPEASFVSDAQTGGVVIRESDGLTLRERSTYYESTRHKPFFTNYRPQFYFRAVDIGPGASFVSDNVGSAGDDQVFAEWDDLTLRGGTFEFLSTLGDGADQFDLFAGNINVGQGSSMTVQVDGEDGRDAIQADIKAIVDGRYKFLARGGNGSDEISTTHELATTYVPGLDGLPPEVTLLNAGGNGNDDLTGWLIARGIEDEWIRAVNDGSRGRDECDGNILEVDCEL